MPFFLATASPVFGGSALTICGLAGATGATNAVVLESIISGSNRQRMVEPSAQLKAVVVQWSFCCLILVRNNGS